MTVSMRFPMQQFRDHMVLEEECTRQKWGMARRAGGRQRLEEMSENPRNPSKYHRRTIEVPSKIHRNITLTSRPQQARSRLAAGSQQVECWLNRMVSGYLLRDVINKISCIHFTSSSELHTLGSLYESMLREMRDAAGDSGEIYTPRPVVRLMMQPIEAPGRPPV
jgi:hypothetical protein